MRTAQIVVVTGASSGIGLASARAFARRGAHLVLASRNQQGLDEVAATCRADGARSVRVFVLDVGDESAVNALVSSTVLEHQRIDVVVHSATSMAYGTVETIPTAVFTKVVSTAIESTFFLARATLAQFRKQKQGSLVIVNSLLGHIAAPEMGAYVTAKWGQAGLIRTLQLETRNEKGIHVSSVSPGGVNTPIYSQAANYSGRTAQPPPPIDPPEKVAAAVVRCADQGKPRVSVGIANPLIVFGFRCLPKVYDALVTPLLHFASLSATPTEPTDGNVFEPSPDGEAEVGAWPHRLQIPKHRSLS